MKYPPLFHVYKVKQR